jgi:hypothetical protein
MNNEELIIHLIREELRNKRLMFSLEELGFDCSEYTIRVNQAILELAGFPLRNDELKKWYDKLIDEALEEITFWNMEVTLQEWSQKIYKKLKNRK